VSLVLLDLDRLKRVNDTHGHERGDAVLRDVAYEIRKSLRSFELVYRIGGEESWCCCRAWPCPRPWRWPSECARR
jgi:diguanylate cyclase (GGDEF)-like protein